MKVDSWLCQPAGTPILVQPGRRLGVTFGSIDVAMDAGAPTPVKTDVDAESTLIRATGRIERRNDDAADRIAQVYRHSDRSQHSISQGGSSPVEHRPSTSRIDVSYSDSLVASPSIVPGYRRYVRP